MIFIQIITHNEMQKKRKKMEWEEGEEAGQHSSSDIAVLSDSTDA